MRIVSGKFRGRPIAAPPGEGTRPTIDRVRESLASSIYSARGGFDGAIVLDAFAGSGALGLEALSRGAAFASFTDNDKRAVSVLQRNVRMAEPGTARVEPCDIERHLPAAAPGPYDLVFLDPPYALPPAQVAQIVARLREAGRLAPGALVCYEHAVSADAAAAEAFASLELQLVKHKKFGKTAVDLFQEARP